MIHFLLTNWWIYIPIVGVLLLLTSANNQRIKSIERQRELDGLSPAERAHALKTTLKRKPGKFESLTSKLGLRGVFNHIFPKK